jgi:soluble lytic murein transglycosylase
MDTLIRYKSQILTPALFALALAGIRTTESTRSDAAEDLPRIESQSQLAHAFELFPRRDLLRLLDEERRGDQREFILNYVRKSLPKKYKPYSFDIARAVISEANHHKMDPMLILAVITTESSFNVTAKGRHGEIGLMQILPATAKWLAPQAGLPRGRAINLRDPVVNIRIGATFLASLRKTFDGHGTRSISAYNMGTGNVRRLVASNVEPKIYSTKVLGNYNRLHAALEINQRQKATPSAEGHIIALSPV